jgi:hypothetical protein
MFEIAGGIIIAVLVLVFWQVVLISVVGLAIVAAAIVAVVGIYDAFDMTGVLVLVAVGTILWFFRKFEDDKLEKDEIYAESTDKIVN